MEILTFDELLEFAMSKAGYIEKSFKTFDEIVEAAMRNNDHDLIGQIISRGTVPPTASKPLPYTGSGSALVSWVYSDYKFSPNSNGKLFFTFDGLIKNGGTSTVTVYLQRSSDASNAGYYTYSLASGWTNAISNTITGLSSSEYYYYYMQRGTPSGTDTLSYTLKVANA